MKLQHSPLTFLSLTFHRYRAAADAHSINTAPTIRTTAPHLRRRLTGAELLDVLCPLKVAVSRKKKITPSEQQPGWKVKTPGNLSLLQFATCHGCQLHFDLKQKSSTGLSYQRSAVIKTAESMSAIMDFFPSRSHAGLCNLLSGTVTSLWRIGPSDWGGLCDAWVWMTCGWYNFFELNSSSDRDL